MVESISIGFHGIRQMRREKVVKGRIFRLIFVYIFGEEQLSQNM